MVKVAEAVIKAAQDAQQKYGIPASISIAQYGLESGWGKYMPEGSNNPFGMKIRVGKNDPYVLVSTREVLRGKEVYIKAKFRKFKSLTEAFDEHAKLLAQAPVYAKARAKLKGKNAADAFADALTGVYATDPEYGKILKRIMSSSSLYEYNDYERIRRVD